MCSDLQLGRPVEKLEMLSNRGHMDTTGVEAHLICFIYEMSTWKRISRECDVDPNLNDILRRIIYVASLWMKPARVVAR